MTIFWFYRAGKCSRIITRRVLAFRTWYEIRPSPCHGSV